MRPWRSRLVRKPGARLDILLPTSLRLRPLLPALRRVRRDSLQALLLVMLSHHCVTGLIAVVPVVQCLLLLDRGIAIARVPLLVNR